MANANLPKMNPLCVFLADDHPTLRMGLRVLLEQSPGIHVVGESGDGKDTLERIQDLNPDVIVLDCQLPRLDAMMVAAEIKRRGIPTRVLVLSSFSEERYVRGMLEANAVGYLLKDEPVERIIEAIHATARGEARFSTGITRQLLRMNQVAVKPKLKDLLTEREKQVVERIVQGKTNKEIGRELGISEKAIEKHISGVFEKWQVNSRAEIAARAVRESLG